MAFSPAYFALALVPLLALYWGAFRTAGSRLAFAAGSSLVVVGAWAGALYGPGTGALLAAWLAVQSLLVLALGRVVRKRRSGKAVLLACLVPLLTLVAGKHLIWDRGGVDLPAALFLSLGVSYYTLKNIHFLVQSGRGDFDGVTWVRYLAYVAFFPMFTAGPIERLERFAGDGAGARFDPARFSGGLERIALGMGKKFILADMVLAGCLAPGSLTVGGAPGMSWGQLAAAAFFRFLFVYVEFSGYTDIAVGTGRLFGYELMENFRFPMLRPNLAEFWRAWHISLSSWVRDYIFFPLLGLTRSPAFAIVAAMTAMGLWHDVKPGWVLWGLHHGVGLALLSRAQRWAVTSAAAQRIRSTVPWRMAGTAAVWWYVSVGHALVMHPEKWANSLKIYAKLMTGGLAG